MSYLSIDVLAQTVGIGGSGGAPRTFPEAVVVIVCERDPHRTRWRRDVRPTRSFYEDVYRYFPLERGPAGEASRVDFQLYELPRLFRDVADQWDGMFQPIPGGPDYRTFISFGILVAALSVEAQLAPDGAIELLSLEVDPYPEPRDEDDFSQLPK